MALDHTIQAGIEHDLRRYRRWLARMEQIREEIAGLRLLASGPLPSVPSRHQYPGDPTGRYVQRLHDLQAEEKQLEVRIRRVERALDAMTKEQRLLVERFYFDGAPREMVQKELGLSRAGFYRLRAAALECYAFVAGLQTRSTA